MFAIYWPTVCKADTVLRIERLLKRRNWSEAWIETLSVTEHAGIMQSIVATVQSHIFWFVLQQHFDILGVRVDENKYKNFQKENILALGVANELHNASCIYFSSMQPIFL